MQDEMIVDLYWERDESAISETESEIWAVSFKDRLQYPLRLGGQQGNPVNDTYLKAWNSMPTHKPGVLSTYLGKITRQLSIDAFRTRNRVNGSTRNMQSLFPSWRIVFPAAKPRSRA